MLPDSAAVAATDRSIPAAMITSVWPTARISSTEYCRRMLRRLFTLKKSGEASENPSTSAARIITAPPTPPARTMSRVPAHRSRATGPVARLDIDAPGGRHDLVLVRGRAELAGDAAAGH